MADAKVTELLDQLDAQEPQGGRAVNGKRRNDRFPFRHFCTRLSVLHPGGGRGDFLIPTRDISETGISILHGGYLHLGTDCTLELPALWSANINVDGAIVRCDHVMGVIHQIAVMFYNKIDPTHFVDNPLNETVAVTIGPIDAPNVAGSLLYVDDLACEARLLEYHLRTTSLKLVHAPTIAFASEAIQSQSFDIIVCDMNLTGIDGEGAIRSLRMSGFKGPIIALCGEWTRHKLTAAREAGALAVLPKPYDPTKLVTNIADLLQAAGCAENGAPIFSQFEQDDETRALVRAFIAEANELASQLRESINGQDVETARRLCVTLKEAGGGYGFHALFDAGCAATIALDASCSVTESRQDLRRVAEICGRLKIRG